MHLYTETTPRYNWNIVESGIKHHNPTPPPPHWNNSPRVDMKLRQVDMSLHSDTFSWKSDVLIMKLINVWQEIA